MYANIVFADHVHSTYEYKDHEWKKNKMFANIVIRNSTTGTSGYRNLLTLLSVCHSPEWWVDTSLIFICVLKFPCFILPWQRDLHLVNGQRNICFCSWCWFNQSETYSKKDPATKERAT
jgi:hypothetical protein